MEVCTRDSAHLFGARILEKLFNADTGYKGKTVQDDQGNTYTFKDYREKHLTTVLGTIRIKRAYYYNADRDKGYVPKDRELGIVGTSFSPGARRMMSRVGAYRPFGTGREDLEILAGLSVTAKEVERVCSQVGKEIEGGYGEEGNTEKRKEDDSPIPIGYVLMDGTGIPVVKSETVGRRGKGADQQAKTREVKLGCVFTQTGVDKEGRPVRDENSTSYVGAIEPASVFGYRLYHEAVRRGLERAKQVCVIGDGAPWIWNLADEHFYGAVQIVDLYHAREHLWNVGKVFFGEANDRLKPWIKRHVKVLDAGNIEQVIKGIRSLLPFAGENKKVLEREMNYFKKNKKRMRYGNFRKQNLFVGSGVVEAGCRTVIGQRLKQSGMHWTAKGANNVIALRCCLFSNRWEEFWENRAA